MLVPYGVFKEVRHTRMLVCWQISVPAHMGIAKQQVQTVASRVSPATPIEQTATRIRAYRQTGFHAP